MELDAKTFYGLVLFFGVLIGLFWSWISDDEGIRDAWKDLFGDLFKCDDYWEDVDWKEDDDDDDKTVNGDHR